MSVSSRSWNSGSQCSMPPCRRCSDTLRYTGSAAASGPKCARQPVRKRDTLSASSDSSATGRSTRLSQRPVERCVAGSKRRMFSTSSPNRSRRTGSLSPAGNTSKMPPRVANSPGSITVSARP